MSEHRSFLPSDFSVRDVPVLVGAYVLVSVATVAAGIFLERLPSFWAGVLCGLGTGLLLGLAWLQRANRIDVSRLPPPSLEVQRLLDDPACRFPARPFVDAVKMYREETGVGLSEATAVLKAFTDNRDHVRQSSNT